MTTATAERTPFDHLATPERIYPLEPLLDVIVRRVHLSDASGRVRVVSDVLDPDTDQFCGVLTAAGMLLGVGWRSLQSRLETGLTEREADHLACRAGMNAGNVWGSLWWSNAPDEEDFDDDDDT